MRRAGENTRSAHLPGEGFADAVAALEGAAKPDDVAGQAFASGEAALAVVLMTFLRGGTHVVAPTNAPGVLGNVLPRFGVSADFVDFGDLERVRQAVRPTTKIIFVPTLSEPGMTVADIRSLYRIARQAGALLVVDSTLATPIVCRPLEHGADLVLHSGALLGGCAGGVVVGRPDLVSRLRQIGADLGAGLCCDEVPRLRDGLHTLPLRIRRMCSTAMVFAAALARHPGVRKVGYPGLPDHPGHQLARQQFDSGPEGTRFGPCVSVTPVDPGLVGALTLIKEGPPGGACTRATVLGDEVRFTMGLEDAEDLIADVNRALDALSR
ncbi:aminotransferase class V-fold PLP-dependent enzyme [Nonomuraea sp. NPDC050556]|uniref:aminotransferase class V-fold PLP-dependent enzyme n=1 Tax=Nonomuraea sp. NPDC050556 TaxID=3364369 RepID=UPI0037AFC123